METQATSVSEVLLALQESQVGTGSRVFQGDLALRVMADWASQATRVCPACPA